MKMIHKFKVSLSEEFVINMPGAVVLCVQMQRGAPHLWALVDPQLHPEPRKFRLYGTGHSIDKEDQFDRYVGTFQLEGGALVFHLFQRPS